MSATIRVYSDYICPYCFFAEAILEQVTKGKDLLVEWMPFELRPAPQPTLKPEGEYLQRVWAQSVYPMAQQLGIPIILPRISPQPHTHLAFEGYQYAKAHGKACEYNHRMFTAFFQQEQDIGDVDVLAKLAGELGLNQEEFKEALLTRRYRHLHRQALLHAYKEARITAVPAFVIGDHAIRGLPAKADLERFIEQAVPRT
ncbi:MAG: 2-hydroxychromene-2-carboxylate isomerase [Nitrospiraceae bacterium]